jgi:hypothetical protein
MELFLHYVHYELDVETAVVDATAEDFDAVLTGVTIKF